MKRKTILTSLTALSSVFIAVFIILLNTKILVSDQNFYHDEFKKYNVYGTLEGYDADRINRETLGFLLGKNELPGDFFNERESAHLHDVKNIMGNGQLLFLFSIAVFLFFVIFLLVYTKNVKKMMHYSSISLLIGSIIVIGFSLLLFLSIKLNFNFSFDVFHTTFFEKNSYIFNPENEKIVLLYPEGLFYDAGQQIILNSALFSVFVLAVSLVLTIKKISLLHNKNI